MQGGAEMVRNSKERLVALEDERRKVEAFKRELPLCMELLDHEIETCKEQLACGRGGKGAESCEGRESSLVQGSQGGDADGGPPVRAKWDKLRQEQKETEQGKRGGSDKPSWMAEAQLWDRPSSGASRRQEESAVTEEIGLRSGDGDAEQQVTSCSPRLVLSSRQRPTGAFLPFIREKQGTATRPVSTRSDAAACNGTDLTLSSSPPPGDGELTSARSPSVSGLAGGLEEVGSGDVCVARGPKNGPQLQVTEIHSRANGGLEGGAAGSTTTTSSTGQANRKARRCWSPELHRRFVSALQQLGGSQVATPKQIRELMKVDGLTNDEVKSHLQKYRLHTRRPGPAPQQAAPHQAAPHLVVLGGIWMPPEYAAAAAAVQQSSSQGISSVPPFCQPALSTPEYYSHLSQSPQLQLRHAPYYEQQQAASQTQSSQQVPKVGLSPGHSNHSYAGDSAGEEGKSDSTSWKGENGTNEDEGDEEGEEMELSRKIGTSG